MRRPALCIVLLWTLAGPLAAQGEPEPHPRAGLLRERIEKRFAERVKAELALNDEQAAKLKAVATEYGTRRRDLRRRETTLRTALDAQIRDGAAPDQDSVSRMTQEILDLRVEYAESWRKETGELSSFLNPVQRARLLVMRERLLQRAHQMRKDRRGYRDTGSVH